MPTHRRALLAACAITGALVGPSLAGAAPPKADGAAFGPFYDLGTPALDGSQPPGGSVAAGFSATRHGDEYDISGPAGAGAPGPRWWLNWDDCARGGSVIREIRWSAARAPTSTSPLHAFRVTDTGARVFSTSANLRDDLAGATYPTRKPYAAGAEGCRAQLRVDQVLAGAASDPAKRYWVTSPRAIVQDVQPPSVALAPLPGGWQRLDALDVAWTAGDNFDGSGLGNHHLAIGGVERWAGAFRAVGPVAAAVDLAGVPDGVHEVRLTVDGDGTGPGVATGTIALDRTPPRVGVTAAPLRPGHAAVSVDVADPAPGSGTAAWELTLPDGAVVASAATGAGPLADLDLSRFDGQDVALQLHARDRVGNEARAASAPMRVDVTPPSVAFAALPEGWVAAGATVAFDLADNRADGLGALELTLNTAANGGGAGEERTVARIDRPAAGRRDVVIDLPAGLADGPHRLTATVRDPQWPQLAGTARAVLRVDATSPDLGSPDDWELLPDGGAARYLLTLPAVRDAGSGVAAVRVLANRSPAGDEPPDGFRPVGDAAAAGQGPVRVALDLSGMPDGRHATVVEAVDGAGNLTRASGPTIVLDRTPPELELQEPAAGVARWTQRDDVGFGACPTVVEIQGVGTQGAWRTLFETPGAAVAGGRGRVPLGLAGMPPGDYQVRVSVCDAAGNRASASAPYRLTADAAIVGGPDLSDARLADVALTARRDRRGAVAYGAPIAIGGRLVRQDGRALRGVGVALRDPAGGWQAGARTDARGAFTLGARATRGGPWVVAALGKGEIRHALRLTVAARLATDLRGRALRLGAPLVVRGRLTPGPLSAGKLLQLQWRDGRRWRPVANATAEVDGRFRVAYTFRRSRGYAVAMRVVAPAERGWPFLPIAGPSATIRVR